jgi:hypothetical protein
MALDAPPTAPQTTIAQPSGMAAGWLLASTLVLSMGTFPLMEALKAIQ